MPARAAPLERRKVAEQIADALRAAIVGGELKVGAPLPSERELAERYDVNRSSVREALLRLEAWGLVEIRQGGATRVRDFLVSAGMGLLPHLVEVGQLDPTILGDLHDLPEVMLMDEPFGSLDAQTRIVLQDELLRIWEERRMTVCFVTHNIEEAILLGDRIIIMTARPGAMKETISVDIPRPRSQECRMSEKFSKLYAEIWRLLKEEVEKVSYEK